MTSFSNGSICLKHISFFLTPPSPNFFNVFELSSQNSENNILVRFGGPKNSSASPLYRESKVSKAVIAEADLATKICLPDWVKPIKD